MVLGWSRAGKKEVGSSEGGKVWEWERERRAMQ